MRHLITLCDVTSAEVARIFAITEDLKTKYAQGLREPLLPGRTLALLFEKQYVVKFDHLRANVVGATSNLTLSASLSGISGLPDTRPLTPCP